MFNSPYATQFTRTGVLDMTNRVKRRKRTKEERLKQRERHDANIAQRAGYHREKAFAADPLKKNAVQINIDEMSKRG